MFRIVMKIEEVEVVWSEFLDVVESFFEEGGFEVMLFWVIV